MTTILEYLDLADDHALLSHQIKDIREKTNRINDIGKKLGLRKKQKTPRNYEDTDYKRTISDD